MRGLQGVSVVPIRYTSGCQEAAFTGATLSDCAPAATATRFFTPSKWPSGSRIPCSDAPGPQAHHLALPPGEARHLAPTAVTGCRHLSTIFVTTPPRIGSLKRLSTSYCSQNHLISQDIFDTAQDGFRVGTRIARDSGCRCPKWPMIVVCGLVGAVTIHLGGIPLSLSPAIAALLASLIFGYLRSVYRTFGRIPGPALRVFNNVGLNGFVAVVGLNAAPGVITGLDTYGIALFLAGIVVSMVPFVVGLYVGKYVVKCRPVILLGACS